MVPEAYGNPRGFRCTLRADMVSVIRFGAGVASVLLLSLLVAPAAAASILVDHGEHPNYDVQMPPAYTEPPPEILESIGRSCPQCRVILGQNVIGYVSYWDPSQTVVWTPFRFGYEDAGEEEYFGFDDRTPDPLPPPVWPPGDDEPDPQDPGSVVPEPATFLLAGAGLCLTFLGFRRRT